MRITNLALRCSLLALFFLTIGLVSTSKAQTMGPEPQATPTLVMPDERAPAPVTSRTNLYCGGFIQYGPSPNYLEVAGGEQEQEQGVYGEGDYVYINAGSKQGMKLGNEYTVARPRGQFKSKLSSKSGWLGVYFQEVGALKVITVKDDVSVAMVTASCDTILLGDLLRALENRKAPLEKQAVLPDRFADPTGKKSGRIVLTRDGRDLLARDEVVFIDLGSEDSVKAGDSLTIFRPTGKGSITHFKDDNIVPPAIVDTESFEFKNYPFSVTSPRVRDANGNGILGPVRNSSDVKKARPAPPRKYVGEMVIISVEQRTAMAVITGAAGEVHPGDYVELQ